jgi:hypothetical protein
MKEAAGFMMDLAHNIYSKCNIKSPNSALTTTPPGNQRIIGQLDAGRTLALVQAFVELLG